MAEKKFNSISNSAVVMITMRWIDRLIGIASTLILARLLVPDDFGIVAMASLVVGFADVIFDLGVNVALIQKKSPEKSFYNTLFHKQHQSFQIMSFWMVNIRWVIWSLF